LKKMVLSAYSSGDWLYYWFIYKLLSKSHPYLRESIVKLCMFFFLSFLLQIYFKFCYVLIKFSFLSEVILAGSVIFSPLLFDKGDITRFLSSPLYKSYVYVFVK
jgi:hypothetical protein